LILLRQANSAGSVAAFQIASFLTIYIYIYIDSMQKLDDLPTGLRDDPWYLSLIQAIDEDRCEGEIINNNICF
jgi:hypothetical protein